MIDKNKAKETTDKYIARMRAAADEAKRAFDKSLSEFDRIGNEMYADMRVTLKDSGIDLDTMQAKMKENLTRETEELKKGFWHVQSRMIKIGEDVEQEIRKSFKQS